MWVFYDIWHTFITILFPPACFICKKENVTLCTTCTATMARAFTFPYTYSYSYFSFKDTSVKQCIHAIKYYHRPDLIEPLVKQSVYELEVLTKRHHNALLVPIPTTRFRTLMRGYNQAERIAKAYGKILNIPVTSHVLIRTKRNKRQVLTRSKSERLQNQMNTFIVNANSNLPERTIILIDDVTTTGATLHEARRVLLASGAKDVFAYTLAH